MSALAFDSSAGREEAKRSRSSSMARPISLEGGRSSASSTTPSDSRHESVFPLYSSMRSAFADAISRAALISINLTQSILILQFRRSDLQVGQSSSRKRGL